MASDKKILDDLARVAGGAVNILSGLQQQVREEMRSRVDDIAARVDLVPRADFEQARDTIKALTRQVEIMEKRLNDLEKNRAKKDAKAAKKKKK